MMRQDTRGFLKGVIGNDGTNYVFCGNCGKRIRVKSTDAFMHKKCFKCGSLVTPHGTFEDELDYEAYMWRY